MMSRPSFYSIFALLLIARCSRSSTNDIIPLDPQCQNPLGLENGKISNSNIRTEENAVDNGKEGYYARLNNKLAWCTPSAGVTDAVFRDNIYLEIRLLQQTQITAIALQGWKNYGYGSKIRIKYDAGILIFHKTMDDKKDINVQNLKFNSTEYLILSPVITTRKLQIFVQFGSNPKCLRAELYGCEGERDLRYQNCAVTTELLTDNLINEITESYFFTFTHSYDGRKILFTQLYAWCIKKERPPLNLYKDWVQIDMKEEKLIYGLKVDGYRKQIDVESDENIATDFKLEYSLDGKTWASYEGGKPIVSRNYRNRMLEFKHKLVARYIKVFMRVGNTENTCLKIQLYGCKALPPNDKPEATTPPPTGITMTTPTLPETQLEISQYKIPQGNTYSKEISWTDLDYRGKENDGRLSGGKGCLIDGIESTSNPEKDPNCWIGWRKMNVSKPTLELELRRTEKLSGLVIRTYIDAEIGARPVKRFVIKYSASIAPATVLGYLCTPEHFYNVAPQVKDFYINLNGIHAQHIKVEMEYSSEWILIRQVWLKQGSISEDKYMKTSSSPIHCDVPIVDPVTSEGNDSTKIIIIVCVVLGLLLLVLLAFLVYHYRTSLHKVFKARANDPIILRTSYEKERSVVHMMSEHNGYDRMNRQPPYMDRYNSSSEPPHEDFYAAPADITSIHSDRSLLLPNAPCTEYDQVSQSFTDGSRSTYAQPTHRQQYAEPNSESPIYQGSAIYAKSYVNPYQAVVASSMYADPDKVSSSAILRHFPREQLSFKEKIGVGQFGEVHIAEATGLDEVYGNVGHYNPWGNTDTALVAVKLLKSDEEDIAKEFLKEVELIAQLKHESVVRLLGVCRDKPIIMVCEYMENGDLNQFLRSRKPCDQRHRRASSIPPDVLLVDSLLHMAQQIAAGMKYLHSEGFIHRDLATRNCLVGPAYQVKIADFGMSRSLYSKQYYRVEGKAILPIRWMAPECMFYGKFTNSTDVWSFGVTLWEIFSFARNSPYEELNDSQVIELCCEAIQQPERGFSYLEQPLHCPPEVYKVMRKCWNMDSEQRPAFGYINRVFTDICNSHEADV